MAEYRIVYFFEDLGHQDFIVALVKRVLAKFERVDIQVSHDVRNARGGNQVRKALAQYLADVRSHKVAGTTPDLLIISRDTNRVGRVGREHEMRSIIDRVQYSGEYVLALPSPYLEAWYFADPHALQRVLELPQLPVIPKGEPTKERYKQAMRQALATVGVRSPFGGSEYAEDIVANMDLYAAQRNQADLRLFVDELEQVFHRW